MRTIILAIVEGPSDEIALIIPLFEEMLKKRLKINVKVMHGDILTRFIDKTEIFQITSGNVKLEITNLINEYIKKEPLLKQRDLLKVIYITDTDRCFFDEKKHHLNKRNCLDTLFKINEITLGKGSAVKNIPFDVIFMNENLEHILTLKSKDFSDDEKKEIANRFSEECEKDFKKYIETFTHNKIKTWISYDESYTEIKKYENVASNMNNFLKEFNLI